MFLICKYKEVLIKIYVNSFIMYVGVSEVINCRFLLKSIWSKSFMYLDGRFLYLFININLVCSYRKFFMDFVL